MEIRLHDQWAYLPEPPKEADQERPILTVTDDLNLSTLEMLYGPKREQPTGKEFATSHESILAGMESLMSDDEDE